MDNILTLLNNLVEELEKEQKLLVITMKDWKYSQELLETVERKKQILDNLSKEEIKDITPYKELLEKIKTLSEENFQIGYGNIRFIEELFDSIFVESPKQYTSNGTTVSTEKKGLFNKKI